MKEKELSPIDLELSRQNFELAAQQNTEQNKPLSIDFNEIAKSNFPRSKPRLLDIFIMCLPCVQAYLREEFTGSVIGKFTVPVLTSENTFKDLKNLTAIDEFLALLFFAINFEIKAPEERAKLYQMFQHVHIENYVGVPAMVFVSRLLKVDNRTLDKDIKNAKFN